MESDGIGILPRRWTAPAFAAAAGLMAWLTYQQEPRHPYVLPHLAGVSLFLVLLLASLGLAWLRAFPPGHWMYRACLACAAVSGCALYVLQPNGVGAVGIYGTALAGSRRGRFGSVIAAATGAAYAFLLLRDVPHSSPLDIVVSLVGYAAAYGYSAAMRQVRADQVEQAAAGERQRLAREIHDVLAHTLSALAVQLEAARLVAERRPGDPDVMARIERAHRLASEGLDEARRAVGALRGESLPGPGLLPRLASDFERESGVPCRLEVEGAPVALKPDSQLAIYRAAQEALTNVRRHSRPAAVLIHLDYRGGGAELTVEDRGAARPPAAGGGYGLTGMRERAELLGGSLEAGPTDGGFRLTLRVPAT
jgi:signal transduction histidine kinase